MKSLKMWLFILPLIINTATCFAVDESANALPLEEEEGLITDRDGGRDRGARERPNLYDYNRQNVQYNRRYNSNSNSNNNYYNQSNDSLDTFNRSYYQDNTSPDMYLNR